MALGRELDVYVGAADATNILTQQTAVKVSDLDMSFNVVRSNRDTDNKASFKIYNAQSDTRNEILKVGNNVMAYAGHTDEQNLGLIYAGNITEAYSYKETTGWVTEIKATTYRSKNKNSSTINVSLSFEADSILSDVLKEIATLMGLAIIGTENTDSITLPNGFHFMGTLKSALKTAALLTQVSGVAITTDNQEIQIYNIGVPTKVSKVLLRYEGTLFSIKENSKSKQWVSLRNKNNLSKKILVMESLLDPRLAPNASVFVDATTYTGEYVINEVNFYGDNFGGKFNNRLKVQSVA